MKKYFKLLVLCYGFIINAQTPITDANFQSAINNCLATNTVDGMCSESEYGAMPDWDVSNVTDMSEAFRFESGFNADISSWDVSSVTNMANMFGYTMDFNADISSWDVGNVINMRAMFFNNFLFNQDIGSWDVSSVTNMGNMFWGCSNFNQDFLGTWDVSNVTNFTNFVEGTSISVANYDALFTAWSSLTLQQGVTFSNSNLQYCTSRDARQSIIDTYGWVIEDAGLNCSNLGVNYQYLTNISMYPNPVNDKLFIQGLSEATKVSIYNTLGKLLLSKTTTDEIDVDNLQSGVYIVKIVEQQKEIVLKFIKN
jgi:surface protein